MEGGVCLDSTTLTVIIIIIIAVVLQQSTMLVIQRMHQRKKGGIVLTKELIAQLVGKTFAFSFAMSSGSMKGKVLSVQDNWIELQTKQKTNFVNADYITSIVEVQSK